MVRARVARDFLLLVLAAVLMVGLLGCTGQAAAGGKIALHPQELDFGVVPSSAPVHRVARVRNEGDGWLEITGISTSCGCTTAEMTKRHLAPGEAADLKVTFDPQVHRGETGRFLRQVYIRSTDPDTPEATFTFWVTVVGAESDPEPVGEGGIRGLRR